MRGRSFVPFLALAAACGGGSSGSPDANVAAIDAPGNNPDAPAAAWSPPTCATVKGTGGVTFTHDEGKTLAPTDTTLTPPSYTMGLVALATPGRLLAGHDGAILRSDDAGCTWRSIGTTGDETVVLVAAGADRAYGWADNRTVMVRVDGTVVTPLTAPGTEPVVGLAVDPANPAHVRLGDGAAQLWDSTDSGASWQPVGVPAIANAAGSIYRVAFDPTDLGHVLVGASGTGAWYTTDGGAHWKASTGTAVGASGRSNVFQLAISPSMPSIVWAQGIDISDGDARHVWRSADGGQTFTSVFVQGNGITLQNGPPMFAHPTNPDVVYIVFGVAFQNYGTDLYRYDFGTKAITTTHNPYHRLFAVAFLPGDPTWMFFGVSLEPTGGGI
jgi:hypothetical protein